MPLLLALLACKATDPVDSNDADSTPDSAASADCAPPDADPAPTPEGHPADGWRWVRRGPLFDDTTLFGDPDAVGYNEGALAPTLVDTGAGLRLLFLLKTSAGTTLYASTSEDGLSWTPPEPVTGLDDGGSYPSLLHDADGFTLWQGSGSVARSTSEDGLRFTPGETVLRAGGADFDSLSLLYPHAVRTDDGVELYYTGFDGARFAIGRADCAPDGTDCAATGPLLERDPEGWDNAAVAMPEVVVHAGETHIWYGGYDELIANPGPWRIGRLEGGARRVSLPLTESGVEAWSTRDPAVVPWGDGWLIVYVGMGDDGVYRLVSATSDVCSR